MTDRPKSRRRWLQFSMRTLMLITTLWCVMLGVWSIYVKPYRDQARAWDEVRNLQGEVKTEPAEGGKFHSWLVRVMVGDKRFAIVTEVDLRGKKVSSESFQILSGLPYVQRLYLDHTPMSDSDAALLREMGHLKELSLKYTKISDAGMKSLRGLPSLNVLYLTGTKVSDAAVTDLSKLKQLQQLFVRWTQISARGVQQLKQALPLCKIHREPEFQPSVANESGR